MHHAVGSYSLLLLPDHTAVGIGQRTRQCDLLRSICKRLQGHVNLQCIPAAVYLVRHFEVDDTYARPHLDYHCRPVDLLTLCVLEQDIHQMWATVKLRQRYL